MLVSFFNTNSDAVGMGNDGCVGGVSIAKQT